MKLSDSNSIIGECTQEISREHWKSEIFSGLKYKFHFVHHITPQRHSLKKKSKGHSPMLLPAPHRAIAQVERVDWKELYNLPLYARVANSKYSQTPNHSHFTCLAVGNLPL